MKALLVMNPTAGREKPDGWADRLLQSIRSKGITCELARTEKAGDATSLARQGAESGYDLIIAAGGDGTVNEVINGLVGTGATLGIIPLGTVNVLARELGISLRPGLAVRTITRGVVKKIDVGRANDRYFTLMAGFGFDAEVVANVLQPIKDWIGGSAYILKGLEMLATYHATDMVLEMPEETYKTTAFLVVVANASTYAYDLKIAPLAMPDDGVLDICVFEKPITDRIGFMRQVADVFVNRHLYHKAVRYFRTTGVKITSEPDVQVQLDGDPFGTTPVDISILPASLPVIVPQGAHRR